MSISTLPVPRPPLWPLVQLGLHSKGRTTPLSRASPLRKVFKPAPGNLLLCFPSPTYDPPIYSRLVTHSHSHFVPTACLVQWPPRGCTPTATTPMTLTIIYNKATACAWRSHVVSGLSKQCWFASRQHTSFASRCPPGRDPASLASFASPKTSPSVASTRPSR